MVERLEELGLLATRADVASIAELEESLDAIELLQAWVEGALARATQMADATLAPAWERPRRGA